MNIFFIIEIFRLSENALKKVGRFSKTILIPYPFSVVSDRF